MALPTAVLLVYQMEKKSDVMKAVPMVYLTVVLKVRYLVRQKVVLMVFPTADPMALNLVDQMDLLKAASKARLKELH